MAAAVPNPLRQTNFDEVKRHLEGMATEIGYCSNLGPVQQANNLATLQRTVDNLSADIRALTATVAALNITVRDTKTELNTKIDTVKTELNAKIDTAKTELNAKIDTAKTELKTELTTVFRQEIQETKGSLQSAIDDCDFNNRARVANAWKKGPESRLQPLRNTTTHQVIELPQTLGQLEELPARQVSAILTALGQVPQRSTDRMTQLKQFIGV